MSDIQQIIRTLTKNVQQEHSVALCVVIKTKGSTPQPAGACMLVRSDMSTVGTLGGGCVEAEVCKRAYEHLLRGDRTATFDFVLDHLDGWDDGLICGGRMWFGVNVLRDEGDLVPYRAALKHIERREPAFLPIIVEQEGKALEYRIHVEIPPTLIIAGAGHVGQAVARLAAELGFHITVIDDREDMACRSRFADPIELAVGDIAQTLRSMPLDADSYVVIVTRGHQHDHQALDAVIRKPAGYIGLIGSRRKAGMIFDDLQQNGATAEQTARVHTPIGLPIGAVTVPEIAVSIAAQLVQVRRQKAPVQVEGPFDHAI